LPHVEGVVDRQLSHRIPPLRSRKTTLVTLKVAGSVKPVTQRHYATSHGRVSSVHRSEADGSGGQPTRPQADSVRPVEQPTQPPDSREMTKMVPDLPKTRRIGDHYCHLEVRAADRSATRTRHPTSSLTWQPPSHSTRNPTWPYTNRSSCPAKSTSVTKTTAFHHATPHGRVEPAETSRQRQLT